LFHICFSSSHQNWDQVSKSIGDAYLKRPEFSFDPSFPRFHLPDPISRPVLSAEPSMCSRVLQPNDKFVIFASDGLWEHMTNQEAAEIVHNNPRTVCLTFRLIIFFVHLGSYNYVLARNFNNTALVFLSVCCLFFF